MKVFVCKMIKNVDESLIFNVFWLYSVFKYFFSGWWSPSYLVRVISSRTIPPPRVVNKRLNYYYPELSLPFFFLSRTTTTHNFLVKRPMTSSSRTTSVSMESCRLSMTHEWTVLVKVFPRIGSPTPHPPSPQILSLDELDVHLSF